MVASEKGKLMAQALKAVADLHSSTSRMLMDCDLFFRKEGQKSLFGNTVTRDLTYSVDAVMWMAEGVFRYWELGNGTVAAVVAMFHDKWSSPPRFAEPLVVFGRLQYKKNQEKDTGREDCQGWDLWTVAVDPKCQKDRGPQTIKPTGALADRIEEVSYCIVSPFELEKFEDLRLNLEKVGLGDFLSPVT